MATEEIRFGDNDRLAALVAALVHADLLVLLSDVDGLYTGDPVPAGTSPHRRCALGRADLDGVAIGRPAGPGVGTGGMVTKVEAARIATGAGIPVLLDRRTARPPRRSPAKTSARFFHRVRERPAARLFWLAHATTPQGRLHLDDGAVAAVVSRRAVAAAAGITGVDGQFIAGDPVDLVDTAGTRGRPRAGELRRRRAPRPARPLHSRPGRRPWPRLRKGGHPPRRPRPPLTPSPKPTTPAMRLAVWTASAQRAQRGERGVDVDGGGVVAGPGAVGALGVGSGAAVRRRAGGPPWRRRPGAARRPARPCRRRTWCGTRSPRITNIRRGLVEPLGPVQHRGGEPAGDQEARPRTVLADGVEDRPRRPAQLDRVRLLARCLVGVR